MRIHIIACRILSRELSYLASHSPHQIDITWVGRGLHNTPEKLRHRLCDLVDDLYRQIDVEMSIKVQSKNALNNENSRNAYIFD